MTGEKFLDIEWSLEEKEDGFVLILKGDKEILRPKLEAIESYHNHLKKVKAEGWPVYSSCENGGFINKLHEHFKSIH